MRSRRPPSPAPNCPAFELQITQSINQLSQLLGREPEALRSELDSRRAGAVAADRRVDRSAGRARATPARHPRSGGQSACRNRADRRGGGESVSAPDARRQRRLSVRDRRPICLKWASRFGSFGPTLDLPIFDRGRWTTVRLYDVRAPEAALAYQRTVLNALARGRKRARRLCRRPAAAHVAGGHGRPRTAMPWRCRGSAMRAGSSTFIDVLDAERTLQQNELVTRRQHDCGERRSRPHLPRARRRLADDSARYVSATAVPCWSRAAASNDSTNARSITQSPGTPI